QFSRIISGGFASNQRPEPWLARLLTARRLRPPAHGWPLRLPWDHGSRIIFSTAKRLRRFLDEPEPGATALRLESTKLVPSVTEAARSASEDCDRLRITRLTWLR